MPRVLPLRLCSLLHGEMHSHHFGLGMVLDPAVCERCPDRAAKPLAAPREEAQCHEVGPGGVARMREWRLGRIMVVVAWFDLWVGAYYNQRKRRLYVFLVPCIGVAIDFGHEELDRPDLETG